MSRYRILDLRDGRVEQRCAVARAGILTALGGYDLRADPTVNYLLTFESLTQAAK